MVCSQWGCQPSWGKWGPNSSLDLVDPSSWALVFHKPNAEGSDGVLPPHLHVSTNFVRTVLAVNTLMCQQELPFSTSDLLHVCTVVRPKKEPGAHLLKGNHYLRLRNPHQPQTRLVTENPNRDLYINEFVWVSAKWKFWAGGNCFFSPLA